MLASIKLPPGLYRNGTEMQSAGRWYAANLMRWHEGRLRPIGGWRKRVSSQTALTGVCRAILPWRENGGSRWIALGTHRRLSVMNAAGAVTDITPLEDTNSLGATPIATTNGSATITVTDTGHGGEVGQEVLLSGATAVGGLTTGQLNTYHTIVSVPNANTWTAVVSGAAATSTTTGGGGSITAKYLIAPGLADATVKRGYGKGTYGSGLYGTPRSDTGNTTPATVPSLDMWGEYLLAMNEANGALYEWQLNTANRAAVVTNAPTAQEAMLVTTERFVFTFKGRTVTWCDQEDNTTWTPAAANQAGDFDLPTSGSIQQGLKLERGALLLTTTDAWQASYTDPTYVYRFDRVGEGCGAISRKAAVSTDRMAAWMGSDGFYAFDGYVQRLECDVADYVFSSLNTAQKSKVTSFHNAAFSEVWWFYPSADSTENNRAVVFNYRENTWNTHTLTRTAAVDKGVYATPMMVGADGFIYEHEVGVSRGGALPYAETGPIKPGEALPIPGWNPNYLMEVQRIVPDEESEGAYTATFYTKTLPNSTAETTRGPYAASGGEVGAIFQAGQFRLRLTATADTVGDVGPPRLDLIRGDALV